MIYSKEEIQKEINSIGTKKFFSGLSTSKRFKETLEYLQNLFKTDNKTELFYLYVNSIISIPLCSCGNRLKFKNFSDGYGLCSDMKCLVRKQQVRERYKTSMLERYGVENPLQSEEIQNRVRKTNLERYGVESALQSEEIQNRVRKTNLERYGDTSPFGSKEIQNRIRQTNIERYGVENPLQSEEIQNRIRQTNIERYGVENPLQSEDVKKKVQSTLLENYGVVNPSQSEEIKFRRNSSNLSKYGVENPLQSEDVKKKISQTNLERYGVESILQSEEIQNRIRQTNLERYGVENPLQSEEIQNRVRHTNLERYGCEYPRQSDIVKMGVWQKYYSHNKDLLKFIPQNPSVPLKEGHSVTWKCCGHVSEYIDYNGPMSARCPICDPPLVNGTSRAEQEILDFVKSIYTNTVLSNDRTLIKPKELDIYIPDRNLAIEYNGVYWHSSGSIEEDQFFETRHYNKTLLCGERGINLFHVSEFDWQNVQKKEIIKSMIQHKLGLSETIYARDTTIAEVSPSDSREFLERNHLQGNVNAKIRLGLYHHNRLVSLMTFGKPRFNKNFEWELLRFCNVLGSGVVGGASKLLKHFRTHHTGSIISYANRDHSLGNLYQNLGFELVGESSQNYVWFGDKKIYSRYETQKHKLKNLLGDGFDENMTEAENMYKNGFRRIFDSGNLLYHLS